MRKREDKSVYFIPFGLMVGCIFGILVGLFMLDYLLLAVNLGTTSGFLVGIVLFVLFTSKGSEQNKQ